MARPVDEKIVAMKLDNSDFQKNAESTISIFGRLTSMFSKSKDLDFSKSTKSLGQLEDKAAGVSLQPLANAVDGIASRFSIMGMIGVTALQNITNRVVDAGISMAKAFSTDQVRDGFNEYELKMKSIQTIMSNTMGKSTLEDVNKTLNDLNEYADKTIYNFAEMTRNIGTFTAAGVGLQDSADAIQGIANLAAASGSNSQQASTAMYQLSQAIANGKVNLQDWNSVVNAGMGGKLFQNALQETAEKMGIAIDRSKSFRESLQDDWLTTDVLLSTLRDFAADESMLEAATKVRTFTQLMDTLKEAAGSGWATTWELLIGDFEEAGRIWTAANDVLSGLLDDMSDRRNAMVKEFVSLGGRDMAIQGIVNLFNAISKAVSAVGEGFNRVFGGINKAAVLTNLAQGFRDFTQSLIMSEETAGKVSRIFEGLFSLFKTSFTIVKELGKAFLNMIPDSLKNFNGAPILDFLVGIADALIAFSNSTSKGEGVVALLRDLSDSVKMVTTSLWDGLTNLISKFNLTNVIEAFGTAIRAVMNALKEFFGVLSLQDLINTGFLTVIASGLSRMKKPMESFTGFIDKLKGIVGDVGGGFGVKDLFENLGKSLSDFSTSVKISSLLAIATALAVLTASIKVLESMSPENVNKGLGALGASLTGMVSALAVISKMNLAGNIKGVTTLMGISVAVGLMAGALKSLSKLDPDGLRRALLGMVAVVTTLTASLMVLSNFSGKMKTSSVGLIAFAASIKIIASAVADLAEIDAGGLQRALGALAGIGLGLAVFLKAVTGSKLNVGSAVGLIAVSFAIKGIISSIEEISTIPVADLQKGLITIGLILAELALFTALTSGSKMVGSAAGFIGMALAIKMITGPLETLSAIPAHDLSKGLVALASALSILAVAAMAISGSIGGAAGMVVMAAAINMLVPPLLLLGGMSLQSIGLAMLALASTLTVIAGAALLLTPAVPAMLAFSGTLLAIGAAIALVGAGVSLFATGLIALSTMTVAAVATIVKNIEGLATGLVSLIPTIVDLAVTLVISLAQGIGAAAPHVAQAAMELILGLLTAISSHLPQIITVAGDIITAFIDGMAVEIPRLVDSAVNFIVQMINGMANAINTHGPELISAVLGLIGSILNLLVEALAQLVDATLGWIPGVSDAVASMGDAASTALYNTFNAGQIGSEKGSDFANALAGQAGEAYSAGNTLATDAQSGAADVDMTETGRLHGGQINSGLSSTTETVRSTGTSLGSAARSGASSVSLYSAGTNLAQGLANGLSSMWTTVRNAASSLASAAANAVNSVLKIKSPSRVAISQGKNYAGTFATNIAKGAKEVWSSASTLAQSAVDATAEYAQAFSDALMDNMNLSPVITPILDLTNSKWRQLSETTLPVGFNDDILNRVNSTQNRVNRSEENPGDVKPGNNPEPVIVNLHLDNVVIRDDDDINKITTSAANAFNKVVGGIVTNAKGGRTV